MHLVYVLTSETVLQCFNLSVTEHVQKQDAPPGEKPEPVRTHLRNMIIVPEMIASIIDVYDGKTFDRLEIKVSFCLLGFFM